MDTSQSRLLEGSAMILPGQAVYANFPAQTIRAFTDTAFAKFAQCPDADFIKGYGHRWEGGHDLAIDVARSAKEHGIRRGIKHAGHILLTDAPSKAGIPIPGLSGSSPLGQLLVESGIPKGYLSIHWADGALGILVISEGATDLLQAIHGTLVMNAETFFDTFAEGGIEIALALAAKSYWGVAAFNPAFVVAGGIENILAGFVSLYQTASVYVDPLEFFGSAGISLLIGFSLAYGVAGQSLGEATINALRGGVVGAFFSLSTAFGYGAMAGFISYKLGVSLAGVHNKSSQLLLQVDDKAYEMLVEELCKGNVNLAALLDSAGTTVTLSNGCNDLNFSGIQLASEAAMLADQSATLRSEFMTIKTRPVGRFEQQAGLILDDNPLLVNLYRDILR